MEVEKVWEVIFEDGHKVQVTAERFERIGSTFSTNGKVVMYLTSPSVRYVRVVQGEAKVRKGAR